MGPFSVSICDFRSFELSTSQMRSGLHSSELKQWDSLPKTAQQESYLRGRWLFHRRAAGAGALLKDPQGVPQWPQGWRGSLSHSSDVFALICTRSRKFQRIGIDIESLSRFKPLLARRVIDRRDYRPNHLSDLQFLAAVFSVKEALFKAEYPHRRIWFEFQDAYVETWPTARRGGVVKIAKESVAGRFRFYLRWLRVRRVSFVVAVVVQ